MRRFAAVVTALLALSLRVPAQETLPSAAVIARAGKTFITEDEFVRQFELLPAFGRQIRSQLEGSKAELLYSMVAEKLLAQEAEARGLDRDRPLGSAMEEIRKMLARDELYRREITGRAAVAEQEIVQGVFGARRQLAVSFLFLRDSAAAAFLRTRMNRPGDFDRLQIDSSLQAVRDTASLVWGEADAAIEEAAYRLAPGEVSPVVPAGEGFYILRLDRALQNPSTDAVAGDALTAKVRKTLQLRREKVLLDRFMEKVLRDRKGYAVGRTLREVAEALTRALPAAPRDTVGILSGQVVDSARVLCRPILEEPLVVIDTGGWSVSEVLDRLSLKGLTVPPGNPRRLMAALSGQIRVWVLQELMAREALRRGMDTVADVRARLNTWKDYFLAEAMKERLRAPVSVTGAEVWTYMKTLDSTVCVPQVRIRELRTATIGAMNEAFNDLQEGASLASVIMGRSVDPDTRSRQGISPWFPITDRSPVGQIAWQLAVGERYGPVAVPGGFLYFELLDKKDAPRVLDSAAASRFQTARQEFLRLKQNRKISLYLAQVASERGFAVFEDRVRMIAVTPVPMMTYRILGFGGRMFEVPFVERQIDWLSVEAPGSRIVP